MYSFDSPSYSSLGGLDDIISSVTGGSSSGGGSFYNPDYFDLNTLAGVTSVPSFGSSSLPSFGGGSGYGVDPQQSMFNTGMLTGGSGQAPSTMDRASSLFSGLVGELGGWGGVASLGLGGLSQILNMRDQDRRFDLEKELAKAKIAESEKAQLMQEGKYGDEFAKMHALAQILQDRQGINLDPSLAYAQALRRKYGGSPDDANDFPGVDIGGPMRVGMSSEDRLAAINNAPVSLKAGGLGLLRGGTSGQADEINARLSDGEYVMDADVVAALGDGNTEAGARKLDQMREQVRRHKRGASHKSIPPAARDPMQYMKG